MAETMGTLEASEKWGYSQATIRKRCAACHSKDASQDKNDRPGIFPTTQNFLNK